MVRASALSTQNTDRTHSGGCLIFDRSANGMHSARLECLTGGTTIDVVQWIVSKSFIAKDASPMCVLGLEERISHVCGYSTCLTLHVVFGGTILVIGHDGLHLASCVGLVLIDQVHELLVLRDGAGSCLYRGNDSFVIIDHSMVLV